MFDFDFDLDMRAVGISLALWLIIVAMIWKMTLPAQNVDVTWIKVAATVLMLPISYFIVNRQIN